MKTEAMVMRATGGPEVLARETIEIPEPGPREVRVRVRAVALNHVDLWTRRGLPHVKYEWPYRLGCDIAGEVEALGDGARNVKVGDKVLVSPGLSCGVCARCLAGRDNLCKSYRMFGEGAQGGYTRHLNVPDTNLLPHPTNLDFAHAAARASSRRQARTRRPNAPRPSVPTTSSTTRRRTSSPSARS
jgi:NADPH:quinone reductase-like Zn-dependent oxidoreductase